MVLKFKINSSATTNDYIDIWLSDGTEANDAVFFSTFLPIIKPKKMSKWMRKQLRHRGIK